MYKRSAYTKFTCIDAILDYTQLDVKTKCIMHLHWVGGNYMSHDSHMTIIRIETNELEERAQSLREQLQTLNHIYRQMR